MGGVPGVALLDLPVFGDELAVPEVYGHTGRHHKAHVLQKPQLVAPLRQHLGGIALVEIVIQQGGPLAEQIRAPVVEGLGRLAAGGEGVDGLCFMPDGWSKEL